MNLGSSPSTSLSACAARSSRAPPGRRRCERTFAGRVRCCRRTPGRRPLAHALGRGLHVYCSCDDDCDADAATLRDGPASSAGLGLESLLDRHRVDLLINGHEHNYERNYAVRNGALATGASSGAPGGNASAPEVLVDPAATVYIVSGCAGDVEQHELFTRPSPE